MSGVEQSPETDALSKYAHEIVAHPDEGEAKPVEYLTRYHYAQAQGWHLAFANVIGQDDLDSGALDFALSKYLAHAHLAFLYDALGQGLAGDEAAAWAGVRNHSESAEWVWERAVACGLDPRVIRPYRAERKRTTPPEADQ